jgi:uncharacterized protein
MRIFLDASALAKRYLVEPGTESVVELCRQAEEIILSSICVVEVISGLNRLKREKKLAAKQYDQLKESLAADVSQATILDLSPPIISTAVSCLEHSALRAMDAIHVASAKESVCDLFVSGDDRQCHAARLLRMKVQRVGK